MPPPSGSASSGCSPEMSPFIPLAIAGSLLAADDPRDIRNGLVIPDEGYCDQPYVIITKDGGWLCVLTTGKGREGDRGQHIVATRSEDRGETWSPLVAIEPNDGPEASWAVPLITPSGRVYVFYDYNGDEVRSLKGKPIRADMLGWYVFRYSDDHGKTWSKERYRLPVRVTDCDRANDWGGEVQILWGIDKPKVHNGTAFFGFTKLGRYMLEQGEGWFFRSDNILTEPDPSRISWKMLPEGERGIRRAEYGSVQEEHNAVPLGGDRWFCVYRTTQGFPCRSISEDGGRSWSEAEPLRYAPGGPIFKHPRACPKLFRTAEGQYLLWFHNHGGTDFRGRNPAWIAGGRPDGTGGIAWSAPEIVLYHPDPDLRMSYPDLIEQDGRAWLTETQKDIARVHPIDPGLWDCLMGRAEAPADDDPLLAKIATGEGGNIPPLSFREGFALDLELAEPLPPEANLLEISSGGKRGLSLHLTPRRSLLLRAGEGPSAWSFESDPIPKSAARSVRATFIADGPAAIGTWIIDGRLCDGGDLRSQGWSRIPGGLTVLPKPDRAEVHPAATACRILGRPLRHAKAIAWQAVGR